MRLMSVTRETFHSPISPCGLFGQLPSGDSSRHALTTPLSSVLDCGKKAELGWDTAIGRVVKFGGVERKDDSVRLNICMVLARNWDLHLQLRLYICARTIARMRHHSDKEYSEQDPKMAR